MILKLPFSTEECLDFAQMYEMYFNVQFTLLPPSRHTSKLAISPASLLPSQTVTLVTVTMVTNLVLTGVLKR